MERDVMYCVDIVCRGLADLQRLELLSANGTAVDSTATPAVATAKKSTSIGPIIGGKAAACLTTVFVHCIAENNDAWHDSKCVSIDVD